MLSEGSENSDSSKIFVGANISGFERALMVDLLGLSKLTRLRRHTGGRNIRVVVFIFLAFALLSVCAAHHLAFTRRLLRVRTQREGRNLLTKDRRRRSIENEQALVNQGDLV